MKRAKMLIFLLRTLMQTKRQSSNDKDIMKHIYHNFQKGILSQGMYS